MAYGTVSETRASIGYYFSFYNIRRLIRALTGRRNNSEFRRTNETFAIFYCRIYRPERYEAFQSFLNKSTSGICRKIITIFYSIRIHSEQERSYSLQKYLVALVSYCHPI